MFDQNTFTETLREVKEIVRTAGRTLSDEEMLQYFNGMELTEEQKTLVINYLLAPPEEEEVKKTEEATDEEEVDSKEQSKAFTMYLDEIRAIKEFTEEEMNTMYLGLLSGDNSQISKICDANLTKIAVLADEYANEKAGVEDIIQEGNMAMFIRLTELCGMGEDCGYDVEEEIAEAVNDAMKQYVNEMMGEDNSKDAILGKANLINEARKELRNRDGSEPDINTLSEYTKLSVEELQDIIDFLDEK